MTIDSSMFNLEAAYSNLVSSFYGLENLIFALSYVMGVALVIRGLMMYRIFANQTYGSAQRGEIAGPIVFLIVGIVMLYFPHSIDVSMQTVFGTTEFGRLDELTAYQNIHNRENWYQVENISVKYLKLIGLIAFIRGWVILSKMGHPGAQPGSIAKGIVHVIGGVLLINLIGTIKILGNTFGILV